MSVILFATFGMNAEIDYSEIANLIWHNESGSNPELIIFWNPREEFLSLGIGHFIWYPVSYQGPFEQVFPKFTQFCLQKKQSVPEWIGASHAPWSNRNTFLEDTSSPRFNQLRLFLNHTRSLQAEFMKVRLESELPKIIAQIPQAEKSKIKKMLQTMQKYTMGMYALIDYLNFKGSGLKSTERYNGFGWGLLQVLQEMHPQGNTIHDLLNSFADAAIYVLQRRIKNAPPQRKEQAFLNGWLIRINTYRMSG